MLNKCNTNRRKNPDLVITNYKYNHDAKSKSITDITIKQELRLCQKNVT